jgi:hypothetical protein
MSHIQFIDDDESKYSDRNSIVPQNTSASEMELLQTEITYIENLTILIEIFLDPLQNWIEKGTGTGKYKNSNQISRQFTPENTNPDYCIERLFYNENIDIISVIFSNIKLILEYNKVFKIDIENAIHEGGKRKIADVFIKHAAFFKMYTSYISNCDKANKLLSDLMKNDTRYVNYYIIRHLVMHISMYGY